MLYTPEHQKVKLTTKNIAN